MKISLCAISALLLSSAPSFAIYHGYNGCEGETQGYKVALSERQNHEGLGFDGLKLVNKKSKKETIISESTGASEFGSMNKGDAVTFTNEKKKAVRFTVLSAKTVSDNSKEGDCSIETHISTKLKVSVEGLGAKSETITLQCEVEGFNPTMCGNSMSDREDD
ncbi:MAG: hypothetical protein AB7K68_17410 [Bacteriovoracia bacterium]